MSAEKTGWIPKLLTVKFKNENQPRKLTDFYLLVQLNKKQLTALVHDLV